jgi:hypothetical protein
MGASSGGEVSVLSILGEADRGEQSLDRPGFKQSQHRDVEVGG